MRVIVGIGTIMDAPIVTWIAATFTDKSSTESIPTRLQCYTSSAWGFWASPWRKVLPIGRDRNPRALQRIQEPNYFGVLTDANHRYCW